MAEEVFRDVRVGPERRVEGAGVEWALGAVGAARAGGKRPAGLPLGRRRGGAVGAAQYGEDAVLPLWRRGRGRQRHRRRTGGFWETLLSAHLLLLDLQEGLLCRDRGERGVSERSSDPDPGDAPQWPL